jgi:hypothetical protein
VPRRIENVIRSQPSTRATIQFIGDLQARTPAQDQQNVKTWLKEQTTAVLSSIKAPTSVDDAQVFVNIAKSEGLIFFSETFV